MEGEADKKIGAGQKAKGEGETKREPTGNSPSGSLRAQRGNLNRFTGLPRRAYAFLLMNNFEGHCEQSEAISSF